MSIGMCTSIQMLLCSVGGAGHPQYQQVCLAFKPQCLVPCVMEGTRGQRATADSGGTGKEINKKDKGHFVVPEIRKAQK